MKYIKASPEFTDLDTAADGQKLLEDIKGRVRDEKPDVLVIDISECFLDYWGCAPLVEGCMDILHDAEGRGTKTIAIITTMNFGSKNSYASLFFKGTRFEGNSNRFPDIARKACQQTGIEFRIWVISDPNFIFTDLVSLGNPFCTLSSK